jgi:hypothetical protein
MYNHFMYQIVLYIHMGKSVIGMNYCPTFDLSTWTSTSIITVDIANWVRCRTPIGRFRIDTVVGDAFRYGFNLKNKEDKLPRWVLPIFMDGAKWSETFGHAGIYNPDGINVEALPPLFSSSRGGIGAFHENELGNPESWDYYTAANTKNSNYPMEQLVLMSALKTDRDYRGHSVFEPVIDDIMYLQKWRMASGVRAKEYANAGKIAVKTGEWTALEKAEIAKTFNNAKIFTVGIKDAQGKFELLDVGGLLNDTELGLTVEGLKEMIACGFGVTKSDITGANAGEKLGADFNQSSYFMTLEDIQRNYSECAYQYFEGLKGLNVQLDDDFPFKAPREIPMADRVQTLTDIAMSYINLQGQGKGGVDKMGNTIPGDPALASAGASMAQVMSELFFNQAKML